MRTDWALGLAGLASLLLAACSAATIDIPDDALTVSHTASQGEFVVSDSLTPPDDGWTAVASIDAAHFRADGTRRSVWYRFEIPDRVRSDGLMGVYLWRVNVNAAVWWNGEFLGSGGRMSPPPARNWNRPLYLTVPDPLWSADGNELLVHVVGYPGLTWFSHPVLGPDAQLRPVVERRHFFQITVPQALAALMAVLTACALAVWLLRRRDREYLWFGLSAACLLVFQSYLFVRIVPFDGPWWQMLAHWCADAWVLATAAYFYASLGRRVPWHGIAAAAYLAAIAGLYIALPVSSLSWSTPLAHAVSCLISALVGLHMLHLAVRLRIARPAFFALAMGVILATGLHDVHLLFSVAKADWASRYFLFQYAGAVSTIMLAAHLVWRFTRALDETEQLNADLERRIDIARGELQQSFQREQALLVERATQDERERVYGDLHDDVGAKLLSVIYGTQGTEHADLARSALEDLRDSVSRTSQGTVPLLEAVTDWQRECERRVQDLEGVYLDWQMPALADDVAIDPHTRIALGRVLREGLSNALRHARPNEIEVQVSLDAGQLTLRMRHDGEVGDVASWVPGRGLQTMQLRLNRMGGSINWQPDGDGARIEWTAPL